jgi:hypothetical protein
MIEIEYDFSIDRKCEVEYYSEDGGIQYIVNFNWTFGAWSYEGDLEVEVELQDSLQVINGVKHYYYPSVSQVNEMVEFIQEKILEDPNDFGFEGYIDSEVDFYNDNTEY